MEETESNLGTASLVREWVTVSTFVLHSGQEVNANCWGSWAEIQKA